MDANQVNRVINNICEKIGIGVDGLKDFVPMLAKYEIINCIFWIMLGVSLLVVGFCMVVSSIFNIIQWCITPEAKTVIYILRIVSSK